MFKVIFNKKGIILFTGLFFYLPTIFAIDSINFSIDSIHARNWQLSQLNLSLAQINSTSPQLSLRAKNLVLPAPLNHTRLLDIHCRRFHWQKGNLDCQQGQAQLQSKLLNNQNFDFTFQVKNKRASFSINNLILFAGNISLSIKEKSGNWQASIKAKQLDLQKVQDFLASNQLEILAGKLNSEINLQGDMSSIEKIIISALVTELSLQDMQGKLATENISLQNSFTLKKYNNAWHWQAEQSLLSGAVYVEPVYLEVTKQKTIDLSSTGLWLAQKKKIALHSVTLNHSEFFNIHAKADISYVKDIQVQSADINLKSPQLQQISQLYLAPFIEGSELEGIQLKGGLQTQIQLKNNRVDFVKTQLNAVTINDAKQRIYASGLQGNLYWTPSLTNNKESTIQWDNLAIKAIPFAPGLLNFSMIDKHFTLLHSPRLSLLDGFFDIEQFEFNNSKKTGPTVLFRARLTDLSLNKLSSAMNWQNKLSGSLSGYIPAVTYQADTLSLDGSLKMQVFDGEITIKKLASSGLFTDFSRFYIDLEFDNLDLNQVTKKFQTGNIQGRLSGFAHDVYLENWQPISFFAWLGTPENDPSTHLISHKAVRNIASLGGTSAADAISRGVLAWFDNFNYRTLGIGCYLHDGVCQMMGASAAEKGYYLVKGKGLPRIDIIGFNTRVNWNTLVARLKQIASPEKITVEPLH